VYQANAKCKVTQLIGFKIITVTLKTADHVKK